MIDKRPSLVIFGSSNILSDLFDAALATGVRPTKVVLDEPEQCGPRDIPLQHRLQALAPLSPPPLLLPMDSFVPEQDELYLLGPTTPTRARLAAFLEDKWRLSFHTLIHPTAYVSPLATLSEGVFVGANSVIAPGAMLEPHVFINRGVTIGHDNRIGTFSRIQPGVNLGGLSVIGERVTIGLGATVLERLRIGHDAVIAGGAVVLNDVPPSVMVAGIPATVRKQLEVVGQ